MNFKHTMLVSGALGYSQNGLEWPETHNFDACTEYFTGIDDSWVNDDCISGCWGNDWKGYGGCEAPYYFSQKFNQAWSDGLSDVVC